MDSPYSNLTNTIGVGDVVPAGEGTLGNSVFGDVKKPATKKEAPNAFDASKPLPYVVYKKTK